MIIGHLYFNIAALLLISRNDSQSGDVESGLVMSSLIEVPFDDGGYVVVEMDDSAVGVVKAGRTAEVAGRAAQTLDSALESVAPTARAVLAKVREARPQEVTVEFGVKMGGETGVIIAKGTAEVNFKVTMFWRAGMPEN